MGSSLATAGRFVCFFSHIAGQVLRITSVGAFSTFRTYAYYGHPRTMGMGFILSSSIVFMIVISEARPMPIAFITNLG